MAWAQEFRMSHIWPSEDLRSTSGRSGRSGMPELSIFTVLNYGARMKRDGTWWNSAKISGSYCDAHCSPQKDISTGGFLAHWGTRPWSPGVLTCWMQTLWIAKNVQKPIDFFVLSFAKKHDPKLKLDIDIQLFIPGILQKWIKKNTPKLLWIHGEIGCNHVIFMPCSRFRRSNKATMRQSAHLDSMCTTLALELHSKSVEPQRAPQTRELTWLHEFMD